MLKRTLLCLLVVAAAVLLGNFANIFMKVNIFWSSIVVVFEEAAKYIIFSSRISDRAPSGLVPVGISFSLLEGPISLTYLDGAEELSALLWAGAAVLAFVVPAILHIFLASPYLIRGPIWICGVLSLTTHLFWNWSVRSAFHSFS